MPAILSESRFQGVPSLCQSSSPNFWTGRPHGRKENKVNRGHSLNSGARQTHFCDLFTHRISPKNEGNPKRKINFLLEGSKVGKGERISLKSFLPTLNPHPPEPPNTSVFKAFASIEIQHVVWYENVMYKRTCTTWCDHVFS